MKLSRRSALRFTGLNAFGLSLTDHSNTIFAADDLTPFHRFPRMVHNHTLEQVIRAERRGLARKNALTTKAEAEAYVAEVRKRIRGSFSPFPKNKSPLKPKITGTVDRDAYTIENLIFESRPDFLVTANVYVPKEGKRPLPAVVGTCGHSPNGKAAETYQAFAQGLARLGYLCLILDPIGQGERSQYLKENSHNHSVHLGTRQHNLAGNQQHLIGHFLGTWRAWDAMRALDYLLTRDDVDPDRIGVTGNSGGGTMTTWLCGVEPRWHMAAPSCFVTTWRRNMENEIPQDSEQCPPRSLALGLDHDDYLAAMAPKPIIILPQERDYFDVRGSGEVYERLKHLYTLLGATENIVLAPGPQPHGFTVENRESMYRFFNETIGAPPVESEPELIIEKDETLWCTPNGQVAELKSRTVFHFTRATAERLAKQREPSTGKKLITAVRDILRMRKVESPPRVRNLRAPRGNRHYPLPFYINYAVETEPGIQALVTMLSREAWHSRPPRAPVDQPRAILYVSHQSADAELRSEIFLRDTIETEGGTVPIFACDVRGIGESLPGTTRFEPHGYYGPDYFYAAYGNMLNRPYLGGKTHDLLRVIDWLADYGYTKIHLVAKGWGALPATFAALLSPTIQQVTLKNSLTSYHDVATTEHYVWPLSTLLPGVLRSFDLPDCYRALQKDKQLTHIDLLSASEEPI